MQSPQLTGGRVANSATRGDKFADILSQSMETASTNTETFKVGAETSMNEKLQSLLEFLQKGDLSQLEGGEQLAEELLFATEEQQLQLIIEQDKGEFSFESLEELQALLANLSSDESDADVQIDLLQQLLTIVNNVISENKQANTKAVATDELLKLAKMYTLFKNALDLSSEQTKTLDLLKQKLDQVLNKLEALASPGNIGKSAFDVMLNRQNGAGFMGEVQIQSVSNDTSAVLNNPFMNMSKLEQFVLNTQNSSKETVNSEQLLKSFENIISKAQFTNTNGMQKLLIKLNPEHLGSLRVEITQQNGIMIAKIIASTSKAREMLDGQLQGLKQAFVNQNIPVEKLELSQQFTNLSQERNLSREQGQQQGSQTNSEQKQDEDENTINQFQARFEEALLEVEV